MKAKTKATKPVKKPAERLVIPKDGTLAKLIAEDKKVPYSLTSTDMGRDWGKAEGPRIYKVWRNRRAGLRLAYYDLACLNALEGETGEAFRSLEHAAAWGYKDVEHLALDPNLQSLRLDPRWEAIVAIMRS